MTANFDPTGIGTVVVRVVDHANRQPQDALLNFLDRSDRFGGRCQWGTHRIEHIHGLVLTLRESAIEAAEEVGQLRRVDRHEVGIRRMALPEIAYAVSSGGSVEVDMGLAVGNIDSINTDRCPRTRQSRDARLRPFGRGS